MDQDAPSPAVEFSEGPIGAEDDKARRQAEKEGRGTYRKKTRKSTAPAGSKPSDLTVKTITGHDLVLQSAAEKSYYDEARERYQSDNTFTAASDLRSLDRLLLFEVQMFRWQHQLATGRDYDGDLLPTSEETAIRRSLKETQAMISQIQTDLGLTRAAREKEQHDSVGGFITELKRRAKTHGVRREKQLGKALELFNELISIAGAYKRSNENERRKLGFESAEDVVDWVLEVAQPQYDEIDAYFRENEQKFWVRIPPSGPARP